MANPNPDVCRRMKTAIAEEVGNIQGMAERYIAESNDYLRQRIPQGSFDPSWGEDPRKVRYSTAPIPDVDYVDLLVEGNEDMQFGGRDCNDQYEAVTALGDKRGAFGCNLPGTSISGGFDVFFRRLQGKAWQTDPMCAMDLLLKKHTEAYIAMLRGDLPRRAMEQFCYSLGRQVINGGRYNMSAVAGFSATAGAFPAIPTGTLDLGMVRRLFQVLRVQGWDGKAEVLISEEAFNQMRLKYKQNNSVELVATLESNETHHLGEDVTAYEWGGIRWVITDRPERGWLKKNANGSYSLVPVRPTVVRAGTGEGVVVDVNEDYFRGYTFCDGVKHALYEVSYFAHPRAATREAFAMPKVSGKAFSNTMFNFDVRMIDGAFIPCNEDNFKFYFRILHAYAFESLYPELMGAILHCVAPEPIYVNTPPSDPSVEPTASITPQTPALPRTDDCAKSDKQDTCTSDQPGYLLPEPTQTNPDPANIVGNLEFYNEGPLSTGPGQTVRIYVERVGGTLGAASVHLATVNGTASAGTDYTAETADLAWADGEAGRKFMDIPITPDVAATGKAFTVLRSSVTGATWTGGTSVTVEIDNI